MSQITVKTSGGGTGGISTLTGNSGGSIGPDGAGNISILGSGVISITGVAGSNQLTTSLSNGTDGQLLIGGGSAPIWANIASAGSTVAITQGVNSINLETGSAVATSVTTDSGSAVPSSGVVTVSGGTNIATSGTGSTVTVNFDGMLPVASGGTGTTALTDHGVLLGSGTAAVDVTTAGVNGQLLIGSTGADPVFNTPTSTGSTITLTAGPGTLNFETGSAVATSVTTDSGSAVPSSGVITVSGGTNIATTGAGSTVTVNFDGTLPVASGGSGRTTATAYSVICGGTTTTAAHQSVISVGTSGQVLTSNGASALPTFQDASSGGMTWNDEASTAVTMAVNNGYVNSNGSMLKAKLPATSSVGDIVAIVGKGSGGWEIDQNAGNTIYFGNQSTSTGTGGFLQASYAHDCVELACISANADWVVRSSIGNITIV